MRRFGILLAITLLVSSCKDSTSPNDGGSAFDISISGGLNPTYTWDGGNAHSVSVMRTSDPTDIVWGVALPITGVPSPVSHGTVPSGALPSSTKEMTLTAGVEYRISITLTDSRT